MGTLLLNLSGPLQAWGSDSRFAQRKTRHEPTKSGVIGMLAAALGRRRGDRIDDLAQHVVGVRIDQPGRFEVDFQTAHTRRFDKAEGVWKSDKSLPLSNRYYLADARFLAGIEAPDDLLADYALAFEHPAFPLYLGRRACPATEKVLLGYREGVGLRAALAEQPWLASRQYVMSSRYATGEDVLAAASVSLPVVRDKVVTDVGGELEESIRDVPLSFSPENRQYGWRTVVYETVEVPNPYLSVAALQEHDPFRALREVND